MKEKLIGFIVIIFFLNLLVLGCLEEDSDKENDILSWEVINCDKKTKSYIFNWSDNTTEEVFSKITSGISNVSLTIKNTGNIEFSIKVDFEFILSKIIKNEDTDIQIITSNKCPCDSIQYNNNSRYHSDIISLKPDEIKTIYSTINPTDFYGFKVTKWCYEINII